MIVLTLDAGGTNFVFSTIKNGKKTGEKISLSANGNNLDSCLNGIINGFQQLINNCQEKIDAISFAFPGPADFSKGIIGDLNNLSCFRGGVALGPMLERKFNLPVFINNDGDLYAYGEALAGSLPLINARLKANNSTKRYKNLVGLTIGTGFGAGIVHDGILIKGDNISSAEIWATSNRQSNIYNSEEGVSIRAVKYFYSETAKIEITKCPEPKTIFEIAQGISEGDKNAAIFAYKKLGRYIGDSIANMTTLFDGIVVIGGGIGGAKDFIIPGIEIELSNSFKKLAGGENNRTTQKIFCLNNKKELAEFEKSYDKAIKIPFSEESIMYDNIPRCAYVFSDFNTSDMISLGAYYFAKENF